MTIDSDEKGVILDAQAPFMEGVFPKSIERSFMNPMRYRMNYRIAPAYGIFCAVCLFGSFFLMSRDEDRYWPVLVAALIAIAAASIWLLRKVPKVRQAELDTELARYDLDCSHVPEADAYRIAYETGELTLTADGLRDGERFYWYNHLTPRLATSHKFNRVWIALQLGEDPLKSYFLPLNPTVLKAIRQFQIPLENPEELEFLLAEPKKAVAQIYNTGNIQIS